MKTVRTSAGTTALYPRMLYCYKSVTDSLQQLILHHDFLRRCEKWRTRLIQDNTMEDVYDGQVWKDFMQYDGRPFFLCYSTLHFV